MNPLEQYRALLLELLLKREAAGGELSEEDESRFVERLDALWYDLTTEEQDLVDNELAQASPHSVNEGL